MDLIIDANVLFAALIKSSVNVDLIFDENIHLFTPEYLLEEFYKNEEEILEKTDRSKKEFNDIYEILKAIITIIPAEEYRELLKEASDVLPDHAKDTPYFALALKLHCPIWSNEKLLKNQNKVQVYSTSDVLRLAK